MKWIFICTKEYTKIWHLAGSFLFASVVNDVRALIAAHEFAAADHEVREYQARQGATPELAAALSWLARGSLDAKQFDRADSYATETRDSGRSAPAKHASWTPIPGCPLAVGASIEVHAQVLAARGERPEALEFLRVQLKSFPRHVAHRAHLQECESLEPGRQTRAAA